MAEFHYNRAMANQFLFAESWDKYHDRFLTRAYVQEEWKPTRRHRNNSKLP